MNPNQNEYIEANFDEGEYSKWDEMRDRMEMYAMSHPRLLEIEEYSEEEPEIEYPNQFYIYPMGKKWDEKEKKMSPIQGPPDLFQVWRGDQLGRVDLQMTPQQIEQQLSGLISELIRNVSFVRRIGSGVYGNVYEVTADVRNSQVGGQYGEWGEWQRGVSLACKVLRHLKPGFSGTLTPGDIEESLNEMKILRYLRHENICNIQEILGIPEPNTRFPYSIVLYFFELCDGSFAQLIDQHQNQTGDYTWNLPENLNKRWISHIASALEYIHRNGIVHRDIHFENILFLLDQWTSIPFGASFEDRFLSTTFKLTDFGISKQFLKDNTIDFKDPILETEMNNDVGKLMELLFLTSIPKATDAVMVYNFIHMCKTGKINKFDPKEWLTVNPVLKDLFARYDFMHPNQSMTASHILQHQWLWFQDEWFPPPSQTVGSSYSIPQTQTDDSDDSDDGCGDILDLKYVTLDLDD